jgi:hypothetical protein
LHNRIIVFFQGQIETALKNFRADLELRIKKLFAVLYIQSHLTGAGIRKCEGFPPVQPLFVLTNLVFLHIKTVHDLLDRRLKSLVQAQKDAFCRSVQDLSLQIIGRLKRDRTLYYRAGLGYTREQLYQAHKHRLVKEATLGLALFCVPVTCGNGLPGAVVLTKGYKEPDLEARPGGKIKAEPPWAAFFSTDLTLTAVEEVQKYLGRWSIEVFFKEAKQRLGLGQEQGRSFAAQVFSITQAFFRYSLLAYLLEHDDQSQTIGEMFRQREEETGKLTFLERPWQYLAIFLKTVLNTLAHFCDPVPQFREFRAYLDAITNAFNQFSPLQGCET